MTQDTYTTYIPLPNGGFYFNITTVERITFGDIGEEQEEVEFEEVPESAPIEVPISVPA